MKVIEGTGYRCIPTNPERDGYHWVRRYRGGPAIPLAWFANWHENVGRGWSEPDREDKWEYLGPCPSPDDVLGGQLEGWRLVRLDHLATIMKMLPPPPLTQDGLTHRFEGPNPHDTIYAVRKAFTDMLGTTPERPLSAGKSQS